ncbi:hypothetical protein TIFTF001_008973 [Ficus carica]|uniref:Uncharacterized protein n=1 Tax=Ficus carica TaxID=3494 RepID=A0AA88A5Y6_FICCA|nr:hypothetical protein TIFTF001_008973 [Ficus carica]
MDAGDPPPTPATHLRPPTTGPNPGRPAGRRQIPFLSLPLSLSSPLPRRPTSGTPPPCPAAPLPCLPTPPPPPLSLLDPRPPHPRPPGAPPSHPHPRLPLSFSLSSHVGGGVGGPGLGWVEREGKIEGEAGGGEAGGGGLPGRVGGSGGWGLAGPVWGGGGAGGGSPRERRRERKGKREKGDLPVTGRLGLGPVVGGQRWVAGVRRRRREGRQRRRRLWVERIM